MSAPRLEAYGRTALDSACSTITGATKGAQEKTLHRECFAIGGLVAGNVIKESEARARLIAAAREMPAYGEKWAAIERKVELSFQRGMQAPRKLAESTLGQLGVRAQFQRRAPEALIPERRRALRGLNLDG